MAFGFFKSLVDKFTGKPVDWDELEESLNRADLGVPMTLRILEALRARGENLTAKPSSKSRAMKFFRCSRWARRFCVRSRIGQRSFC